METSDEPKRKRDDVVREIGDALERAFIVKDIEGARAILFHDLGKPGLTVDEALAVIKRSSIFQMVCLMNEVPLLSLILEYLEENNRLTIIDDGENNVRTPLCFACGRGSLEAATLLLDSGADVNKGTTEGLTPLHVACLEGHDAVVKLLLLNGADKNRPTNDGLRPIDLACYYGHEQVLSTLLVFKADFGPNRLGRLPIELATNRHHRGCVKILRECPAKSNQETVKLCVSRLKREGMYEVVNAVPMNNLSKEMFVFNVLEEMMSRQMYGLAEMVVAFVGTGEPLPPPPPPADEEEEESDDDDDE